MQILNRFSLNDYLNKKYDQAVFCNISLRDHVERNDGKDSSYQDFMLNPHEYKSKSSKLPLQYRYAYNWSLLGFKISKIIFSKSN